MEGILEELDLDLESSFPPKMPRKNRHPWTYGVYVRQSFYVVLILTLSY